MGPLREGLEPPLPKTSILYSGKIAIIIPLFSSSLASSPFSSLLLLRSTTLSPQFLPPTHLSITSIIIPPAFLPSIQHSKLLLT